MTNVIAVIGAGSIGQAIVRRVAAGKQALLADIKLENADAAAKTLKAARDGKRLRKSTIDKLEKAFAIYTAWDGSPEPHHSHCKIL